MQLHYYNNGQLFWKSSSLSWVVTPFFLINKTNNNGMIRRRRQPLSTWGLLKRSAVENESSSPEEKKYEVDTDKARKALEKLDQQLLSLSNKQQLTPTNTRAKYLERPQPQVREEAPDFSGSFLPYSAFALLLFSIFYNVIFIMVIRPSIDFPEQVEATIVGKSPAAKPMPQAPPTTEALKF